MSCWRAQIDTKTPKRGPIVSVELYILSTWRMPLSLQYEAAFDNKPQMSGFNSRFSLSFSSLVSNPRVPALVTYMIETQAWLKPDLRPAYWPRMFWTCFTFFYIWWHEITTINLLWIASDKQILRSYASMPYIKARCQCHWISSCCRIPSLITRSWRVWHASLTEIEAVSFHCQKVTSMCSKHLFWTYYAHHNNNNNNNNMQTAI